MTPWLVCFVLWAIGSFAVIVSWENSPDATSDSPVAKFVVSLLWPVFGVWYIAVSFLVSRDELQ